MLRQEELRPLIRRWLLSRGLEPPDEIRIGWGIPDVVGVADRKSGRRWR